MKATSEDLSVHIEVTLPSTRRAELRERLQFVLTKEFDQEDPFIGIESIRPAPPATDRKRVAVYLDEGERSVLLHAIRLYRNAVEQTNVDLRGDRYRSTIDEIIDAMILLEDAAPESP